MLQDILFYQVTHISFNIYFREYSMLQEEM